MEVNYDLYMSRLFSLAELDKTPLAGTFELTSRCSLDCKMCYIHKRENDDAAKKYELSAAKWIELAEQAKNKGMLLLLLTGGEPLIREDFDEIYTACKNMGLLVSVNTNGMLIDDKKIELFKKYPPQRINVTLYGTSADTYESLCGNRYAFEKVITALKKLKDNNIPFKINYSITPLNVNDAENAYNTAKELGAPIQPVSYMFPPVRCSGEEFRLPPEKAAEIHFNWQKRHLGDEDLLKYLTGFREKRSYTGECDECGEKISCRAGIGSFWVTFDGRMLPCGMMTKPQTKITDFDGAWKETTDARENIKLPLKCSECEYRKYCDICAAVSLAETGSFNSIPEYACKKAREYKRLCTDFIEKMNFKFSGGNEK